MRLDHIRDLRLERREGRARRIMPSSHGSSES
jgi:hypothetical protein